MAFSDKRISEISTYLCFSSQSHFQKSFKDKYGITPLMYRKSELHQTKKSRRQINLSSTLLNAD
ncbi:helix-turn-helix domain-containing protein [Paenibacillus sp. RS8]|uniref:helix-turn-helix domain-containing protein n=1 Tax=unclassified Paenibacillus TaxID=185978 RepID=UPI0035C0FF12